MRRTLTALTLTAWAALPAMADVTYVAQIPLLPPARQEQPDIDRLAAAAWPAYWRAAGQHGFTLADLKLGRFDLNGDGEAELFVMIDSPSWQTEQGKPVLVARWSRGGWLPVGWSFGDEDSVFATGDIRHGWRSLASGGQVLDWDGTQYRPIDRN